MTKVQRGGVLRFGGEDGVEVAAREIRPKDLELPLFTGEGAIVDVELDGRDVEDLLFPLEVDRPNGLLDGLEYRQRSLTAWLFKLSAVQVVRHRSCFRRR